MGSADALVVDSEESIAILLGDCGSSANLEAGDFVEFSKHPEAPEGTIVSAATIRPDAREGRRPPGDPFLSRND